jgi:hypothetical protein
MNMLQLCFKSLTCLPAMFFGHSDFRLSWFGLVGNLFWGKGLHVSLGYILAYGTLLLCREIKINMRVVPICGIYDVGFIG